MCAESFTKPSNNHLGQRAGSCSKSSTSTTLKPVCANTVPVHDLRQALRASQSRPVVERIERALVKLKTSGRHLPQSLLGGAIDYALGQWRTLAVYLDDGRVEIDNNLVENAGSFCFNFCRYAPLLVGMR
jgi:hypothetical protein